MGEPAKKLSSVQNANDTWLFFRKWVQSPRQIAVPIPSSPALARALAALAAGKRQGAILELGAGTGAVTRQLLLAGIDPERLLVVEKERHLAQRLVQRFPGLQILETDALHLTTALGRLGITGVAAVVSSLPLLTIERRVQTQILGQCFELLGERGELFQYTYGPQSPIAPPLLRSHRLAASRRKIVWMNFPPAFVWSYRRLRT